MGFILNWDTVLKTIPAEQAKQLPKRDMEEMAKQEHVWSLHPQRPEGVTYIGTGIVGNGYAYDYYQDESGTYWYESRKETEPVVTKFRYGGGRRCRKSAAYAHAVEKNAVSA